MTRIIDGGYLSWLFGVSWEGILSWNGQVKHHLIDDAIFNDHRDPNYRRLAFPEYKLHREEKDSPEWAEKRARVQALRTTFAEEPYLSVVEVSGYEADDLMACLPWFTGIIPKPYEVVAIDKDLLQIPDIQLVSWDDVPRTIESFQHSLQKGIAPFVDTMDRVLFTLALMGDKSDDIPRLIPPRQLDMFVGIITDRDPFRKAIELFGGEFIKNLYLTVLPGPWCFEPELSPEDVVECYRDNGWFYQTLKPELRGIIETGLQNAAGAKIVGKIYYSL